MIKRVLATFLILLFSFSTHADKKVVFRDYWYPQYHDLPLNHCTIDQKICGTQVANQYCKIMGYEKSTRTIVANNVGSSNYIGTKSYCNGWRCNGFKLIQCANDIKHKPLQSYYYRYKKFARPHQDKYRLAWCYKDDVGCGKKAAYAFCRYMGFIKVSDYKKQTKVLASKTIGDQKLCFGDSCDGFASITCYR